MKKYWQVFKITFQEYFIYRLNFLLWRFRSIVLLLVLYFLWLAAIPQGVVVFGYDQAKILTYILGTSIIRSLVLASRSADVAGEIASGDLSNFLLKPVSYLKYWSVKDFLDKILNLCFSTIEVSLILFLLRPPLILQSNQVTIALAIFSVILGIILYFFISFLLSMVAFWSPENPWPPRFLFGAIIEVFAGGLFPLDILPKPIFHALNFLPFPYLLFFPLNIYFGQLSSWEIFRGFLIITFWLVIFYKAVQVAFQRGLRSYTAWGR